LVFLIPQRFTSSAGERSRPGSFRGPPYNAFEDSHFSAGASTNGPWDSYSDYRPYTSRGGVDSSSSRPGANYSYYQPKGSSYAGRGGGQDSDRENDLPPPRRDKAKSGKGSGGADRHGNRERFNWRDSETKKFSGPKEENHYDLLGVKITATDRELKIAYRRLALQ